MFTMNLLVEHLDVIQLLNFYSAEYLDVGLLRQVHTRNNLHHVYYESSCGTFGRYSALKQVKTLFQFLIIPDHNQVL